MIHWAWLIVAFAFGGVASLLGTFAYITQIQQTAVVAALEQRDRKKAERLADFYGRLLTRTTAGTRHL